MDIAKLYDWFHNYSQTFYSADPAIMQGVKSKEAHSVRVAANTLALARHLQLSERETAMAEAIGLLHDVARYTQWTRFRSFNDPATQYDHGTEGAALIATAGILNSFFSSEEQACIFFAITYHNKLSLPAAETAKILMARIIRDADKLDIFRTLPPLTADHAYSPALIHLLQQQQPLPYNLATKPGDRCLLRLGWLYDLNFDWTLRQLIAEGYPDNLLALLPDDDVFREIKISLQRFLSKANNSD